MMNSQDALLFTRGGFVPVLYSLDAGNGCGGNFALIPLYFMTTLHSVAYKQLISHIFMVQNAIILLPESENNTSDIYIALKKVMPTFKIKISSH